MCNSSYRDRLSSNPNRPRDRSLLEDADYDGRSLSMLQKIAVALNQKLYS
ncbi:MAG: hypothetical protein ACOYN8_05725 [Pseudanabaena sp.]